jgi:histone-lysine N-methyltransferase SETMAR
MEHAPYSPDLAPSDYHVFGPLKKFLAGQRFISDDDAKTAVRRWFRAQPAEFYNSGISKLVMRWDKCLNRGGDYVEK